MAPPEGWGLLVGRISNSRGDLLQQLDVKVENTVTGETHVVRTYGPGAVNSDPYYRENMVLADLAEGLYRVTFVWDKAERQEWMRVYPGQITYFGFRGREGFSLELPPAPQPEGMPSLEP